MSAIEAFDPDGLADTDDFYRKGFAARLAKVIRDQPEGECLVVAITSEWGGGKSSVIKWMCDGFSGGSDHKQQMACIPVRTFNPWGFSGERDMLFNLFASIVKTQDPDDELLTQWQKTKGCASAVFPGIAKVFRGATQAAEVPAFGTIADGAAGLIAAMCNVGISEVKKSVEDRLRKAKKRLVVILDDIDRLERSDVTLLFRILKVNASLPNTTYVLAMDENQVARTIAVDFNNNEKIGRDYLEKIVQVRVSLPVIPSHLMKKFIMGHLKRALGPKLVLESTRFDPVFDALFLPRIQTPRTAKNLVNAIRFSAGLVPGEVDATDLVLLESARLLFPSLYKRIEKGHPYLSPSYGRFLEKILGNNKEAPPRYWEWISQAWKDDGLTEIPSDAQSVISKWFPQAVNDESLAEAKNDWWRKQRLCSPAYHWRYFTHAIIEGDVPDSEIKALIVSCSKGTADAKTGLIEALKGEHGLVVGEKLVRSPFDPDQAKAMIDLLAATDGELSPGQDADTARLAARLAMNISDINAIETIAASIASRCSIEWAEHFLSSLPSHVMKRGSQHEGVRQTAARVTLANRGLERLREQSSSDVEQVVNDIWTVWHHGDWNALKNYISDRLESHPEFALVLLASVCGRGTGESPPNIWHWNGYDSLQSLDRIADRKYLERQVRELMNQRQFKKSTDEGPHRYCSPEELVLEFLETIEAKEQS